MEYLLCVQLFYHATHYFYVPVDRRDWPTEKKKAVIERNIILYIAQDFRRIIVTKDNKWFKRKNHIVYL